MHGLLDAATVLEGDGNWTSTYEIDGLAAGRRFMTEDICTPADTTPSLADALTGYKINPFAIMGDQRFGARCEPAVAGEALEVALDLATDYLLAKVFWNGTTQAVNWVSNVWLGDAGVATVPINVAGTKDTVADALIAAYAAHPDIQPILHLGLGSALAMTDSFFNSMDYDLVVSPAYPKNAVAVTGPLVVRLGTIQVIDSFSERRNRKFHNAVRLAAIEFDPALAVRAV